VFVTQSGSHLGGKIFADDEDAETVETAASGLYIAGLDALVKRWNKSTNGGGAYG
jgi:hypothetical protein